VKGRASGLVRYFVRHHADGVTCREVVRAAGSGRARVLNTDEWRGYAKVEARTGLRHATVRHGRPGSGRREWARDDDGGGVREVHCNGCEGAGTGLRNYLRVFRGVHKKYLAQYVATYETMTNAQQFTAAILQRMCFSLSEAQSKDT
jgi:transposase